MAVLFLKGSLWLLKCKNNQPLIDNNLYNYSPKWKISELRVEIHLTFIPDYLATKLQ